MIKQYIFRIFAPFLAKRIGRSLRLEPEGKKEIEDAQRKVLEALSLRISRTDFGRSLGIQRALTPEEMSSHPLSSYRDYIPLIEAISKGEKNPLWDQEVLFFAESSGSSGEKKHIPITDDLLQNQLNGRRKVVANVIRIYGAKRILKTMPVSFGDAPVFKNHGHIKSAAISAILADSMPFWSKWFTRPSMSTRKIPLFKDRIQSLYLEIRKNPPAYMVVMPVWLCDFLNALSRDQVEEILQNKPVFNLSGMSPKPYLQQLKKLSGGSLDYLESYPSSEGFFGWQDRKDQNGICLNLNDGIYYELLLEDGTTKPMFQVKEGECGELVVTLCNGFFRYAMGDLLRIVSEEPLRVEIIGRKGEYLSVYGEYVLSSQTDEVMRQAALEFNLGFFDYLICPVPPESGNKAAYCWAIETDSEHLPEGLAVFLNQSLGNLNRIYFNLQADGVIGLPEIICLRPGHFLSYFKHLGKVGLQQKLPRLMQDYEQFLNATK